MIGPIVHPSHPLPPVRLHDGAPTPRDLTEPQPSRRLLKPGAPMAKARTDTELTDGQKRQLQQLKARDTEVRAHEQAHLPGRRPICECTKLPIHTWAGRPPIRGCG